MKNGNEKREIMHQDGISKVNLIHIKFDLAYLDNLNLIQLVLNKLNQILIKLGINQAQVQIQSRLKFFSD